MKRFAVPAIALLSVLAGCATTQSPNAVAEAQCTYLARAEGLKLHSVDGASTSPDGVVALQIRVEDAVGRRINAVCNYSSANKAATWAQPLPQGLARS